MRHQIQRRRKKILYFKRAGIPTKSAEELLVRMLTKVDGLLFVVSLKRAPKAFPR